MSNDDEKTLPPSSPRACKESPPLEPTARPKVVQAVGPPPGTGVRYFAVNEALQRELAEQREKVAVDARNAEASARRDAEAARIKETEQRHRAETETERARRHLYSEHMVLAQSAWEDARTTAVMDLLDRHRPQPGQDDLRGFEWFYWYRLCHSELLTFEGGGGYPAYSPDGKRLAAVSADSTVKVWDAATGQETLTLKGHSGAVESLAFSPDGHRLGTASGDQTVKLWDAAIGQEASRVKDLPTMTER